LNFPKSKPSCRHKHVLPRRHICLSVSLHWTFSRGDWLCVPTTTIPVSKRGRRRSAHQLQQPPYAAAAASHLSSASPTVSSASVHPWPALMLATNALMSNQAGARQTP
jgi:hypothetical protein